MKAFAVALILTLFVALAPGTGNATLPKDYQEFKTRYQTEGKTPEGALKLYFEAVYFCIENEVPQEGLNMLRYAMYETKGWEERQSNRIFLERLRDPDSHYIFRSFAVGTSPENGYKMSPDDFKLSVVNKIKQGDGGEYTQLNITSTGADSARLTRFKNNDGLWYITTNAGTYAQVREPKSNVVRNAHDADFDD